MLWFCQWAAPAGREVPCSLLVDNETKEGAAAVAKEEGGSTPARVVPFTSGVFVAEVVDDANCASAEHVRLDLHEATLAELTVFEDGEDVDVAGEDVDVAGDCGSEADDAAGQPVRCALGKHGPDVDHENGELVWAW